MRLLAAAFACCALAAPAPAAAAAAPAPVKVFAFMSRAGGLELQRLARVGGRIAVLAPNWASADPATGQVSGGAPSSVVMSLSASLGFAVWPVINMQAAGGPGPGTAAFAARLAAGARALAVRHGYPGVTLDLEGIAPAQRSQFSALAASVAAALHARGVKLAVYVPRRTAQAPLRSAAAYDWAALLKSADLLLASGYNEHSASTGPGPVSTAAGFAGMLSYAAQGSRARTVPLAGAFGYRWPASGRPSLLSSAAAASLSASASRRLGPGGFELADGSQVWAATAGQLAAQAHAARAAGFAWAGLFSLGREPASFWARLDAA